MRSRAAGPASCASASGAATASRRSCPTSPRRSSACSRRRRSGPPGRRARRSSAPKAVVDRFAQIEPTVLLTVDGYRYGDRDIDRSAEVAEIRAARCRRCARPSSCRTCAPRPEPSTRSRRPCPGPRCSRSPRRLAFDPVPFDHPLYVLFSSGTTGLPKPIVHGHGGILLEHLKALALHTDLGPGDRFCWFTTTGWMMWNYLVSGLAVGSTIVLFDGNPAWPDLSRLWRIAAETRTTYLGLSAPFLMACRAAGLEPGRRPGPRRAAWRRLDRRAAAGGRLPLGRATPSRPTIPLGSLSGGTDVCTGFLGPSPLVPVWAGEISCRMLGARVEAFDEAGRPHRRPRRASSSSRPRCRRCRSACGATPTARGCAPPTSSRGRASGATATGSRSPSAARA